MIPRFQVPFGRRELLDILLPAQYDVAEFEQRFAAAFDAQAAVAFAYGRTAQWAFLRALGVQDSEVVMPAYTCSVVAHAVVLSGNRPVFVDISLEDYNPEPDRIAEAITPRTRAVIAGNTFGYPQDVDALEQLVADAEARVGHKIWLIQDCAHSFGATFDGRPVASSGDVALFGLNISKTISSIFGGMLTFGDVELAERVRRWAADHAEPRGTLNELRLRGYALAATAALSRPALTVTDAALSKTRLLDRWAAAYHLDDQIHFPPDYRAGMSRIGATVGVHQLGQYDSIVERRRRNAARYASDLELAQDGVKAPIVDGATYSHYVVRVADRDATVARWKRLGVQLGELIQYSIPHLNSYLGPTAEGFDNSLHASRHLVNFPINASESTVDSIIERGSGS